MSAPDTMVTMGRLRRWVANRIPHRLRQRLQRVRRVISTLGDLIAGHQSATTALQKQIRESHALSEQLQLLEERLALIEHVSCRNPHEVSASSQAGGAMVSIIMPTFNRAFCLSEAIDSVLGQKGVNWELIIIDDASSDNTSEILARHQNDPRIRLICNSSNCGAAVSRNRGLELAKGELIAYLDSDNVYFPGFLSSASAALACHPDVDLVYGILASEAENHGGHKDARVYFYRPFNKEDFFVGNCIDLNTVMHRRALTSRFGGFDTSLRRLMDWDLLLRYTQEKPPLAIPTLASLYRTIDPARITSRELCGPARFQILRRWYPRTSPARPLRVLFAVWHYPQLSETYIEVEIQTMLRWGVDIRVWREDTSTPASPYPPSISIEEGDLQAAIHSFQPDVIHCHWSSFCLRNAELLSHLAIPVTLRLHGFDVTTAVMSKLQAESWISRIYAYPNQMPLLHGSDDRFCSLPAAFDSTRFRPAREKNRRLVIRTGATLPSKNIPMFLELANRLPEFHFIFAGVTCLYKEEMVDEIKQCHRQLNSRAELLFDVPHDEIAKLVAEAGIYCHTAHLKGTTHATPLGMPISMAEALATGSYVLARRCPEFKWMLTDAGDFYGDIDEAVDLIRNTLSWTDDVWREVGDRALEHAFTSFADEIVLRPMFEDWCRLQEAGLRR